MAAPDFATQTEYASRLSRKRIILTTAAVIAAMGCTPSLEVEAYLEHLMEVLRKGVEP